MPKREGGNGAAETVQRRPRMVVALGRGKVGKSALLTWLAESNPGEFPLRIVDADPNNPTLSARFPSAVTPPTDNAADRRAWLERELERLVMLAGTSTQEDMLLDVGGNDQLLKRIGGESQLVELLVTNGVDPVAVHMIGPDEADLRYLEEVERRGLFCPPATMLVANGGLVNPEQSVLLAFQHVLNSEIVKQVTSLDRGGRLVVMPALPCMREVEAKGLTPKQALDRGMDSGLGLFNLARVRRWMEVEMPQMRELIEEMLP